MFCPRCGTSNSETAVYCVNCGNALREPQQTQLRPFQYVPNYLVQAILVTLFCCLPFGIVAIVYAAQVNGKLQANDNAGAIEASEKAKKWCWASLWTGLSIAVIYFFIILLGISSQ